MSSVLTSARPKPRGSASSVREVSLLGVARWEADWVPGDRVSVSGRVYRVEAVGPRIGRQLEARRYVHLAAEVGAGG